MHIIISDDTLRLARQINNGRGLMWLWHLATGRHLSKEDVWDLMLHAVESGLLNVIAKSGRKGARTKQLMAFGLLFREGVRDVLPYSNRDSVILSLRLEREVREHLLVHTTLRYKDVVFALIDTNHVLIEDPITN